MAIGSEEAFRSGFDAFLKGAYPKDLFESCKEPAESRSRR